MKHNLIGTTCDIDIPLGALRKARGQIGYIKRSHLLLTKTFTAIWMKSFTDELCYWLGALGASLGW